MTLEDRIPELLQRPIVSLRRDETLDAVLARLEASRAEVLARDWVTAFWRLHLAKNGFSKSIALLEELRPDLDAAVVHRLTLGTFTACGRIEEELAYLSARPDPTPQEQWEYLRAAAKAGRLEVLDQALDRPDPSVLAPNLEELADLLWALGDWRRYRALSTVFSEDYPRKAFFEAALADIEAAPEVEPLTIHVLYLERERHRLAAQERSFAGSVHRRELFPGLDGRLVPTCVLTRGHWERGRFAIACSHLRLWEHLVESGDEGRFVGETDSVLTHRSRLRAEDFRAFDFVTFNDRVFPPGWGETFAPAGRIDDFVPAQGQAGFDGYYLSRRMAEHLLGLYTARGVRRHIDIQTFSMFRDGLLPPGFRTGRTDWPLVRHFSLGVSARRAAGLGD
ncbi:MAG: hypothetical protein AAF713_21775 [Pseudomonadota bacterium]